MTADILREKFLAFFKSKKHKIVESDSLAPKDDPTVLFTPAGMNQFKKELMGYNCGFARAATSQRCLRTDDLEKVGITSVHHTFFEMLGNFSFGDYFKKEAIAWAWEFLTEVLKIDKDRLWVSVYKDDDEAYKTWQDLIKVSKGRILRLGDKDNFWPAEAKDKGPNGPCGPCSEIFYDFGKDVGCKEPLCDPTCDCGRFSEVWNLVFTQFNRKEGGNLEPLPHKNIDTGLGLERLAAVMQGVRSNFETDLFKPLVKEIESGAIRSPQLKLVYAVADHIRAIVFAIYDGVSPSNDGRGYVIRKITRKSILHLMALGIKNPFLYKLVPVVADVMKEPYPELMAKQENISQIILSEEKNFLTVINTSGALFQEKFNAKQNPEEVGRSAFALYDTYGIPLDLTREWLDKNKIKFSLAAFHQELTEQKNRSRMQSAMKGDVFGESSAYLDLKETKFAGYSKSSVPAQVLKITQENTAVKKTDNLRQAVLVLDKTCFYAEAGGQVGDTGKIIKGKNIFEVTDTKRIGRAILHIGRVTKGSFKINDKVEAQIDQERRLDIARNHTATHILQAALRKVLGEHVKQQGSKVSAERLRFDFTHFKDVNQDELGRIEEVANAYILDNARLATKEMPLKEAKKSGALAFFQEKYAGRVRVVTVGDFSRELCAGTHLEGTGQIGVLKIIQEGSIASGVRRIEAVTGRFAYQKLKEIESKVADFAEVLGVPRDKALAELQKRLLRIRELEKQLSEQKVNIARNSVDSLIQNSEVVNGITFIRTVLEGVDADFLRKTVDLIKGKAENCVVALGAKGDNRALLVLGVTADLAAKGTDASKLVIKAAEVLGGSGGGRKDFAQAGGNRPDNFEAAFQEIRKSLA